jgi:RHS repeat-associated protein
MHASRLIRFIASMILVLSTFAGDAAAADYEEVIYYHNDALGSPILATGADGELLWREDYSPYGSRLLHESRETDCSGGSCRQIESPWDEKQWFTGKLEETPVGVQYFGARWYEPEIGRFWSVDPVEFDEGNIFSFNRYVYANANPYRYVDPDGNLPLLVPLIFLGKEIAGEVFTHYTGLPAPTIKAIGRKVLSEAVEKASKQIAKSAVKKAPRSTTAYRQGTFANDAIEWKGNFVKGKQWATDNPLSTQDYAKKYGLPAENTGKPDWIVKGQVDGKYSMRPAPASHNQPSNTGGGIEILPDNANAVRLKWFHMPN